ncbi:MAG: hypothetical protein KIT24_06710 [Phycisphaeraceae bacterium]|nr:hypothetical protein [Phycisphaeraceae bacterium]
MDPIKGLLAAAGILLVLAILSLLFMAVLVPMFRIIGIILSRITGFIAGVVLDSLRLVGAILTAVVLVPLTCFAVALGRWSAASHYGRAIQSELKAAAGAFYRCTIGHLLKALSLSPLVEGLEKRLPEVVKAAPGKDKPAGRIGQFDGYTIVGSLAGGGSGGKLYVAEPDEIRRAGFLRQGYGEVGQVVIKAFSLKDGSSLPQIVRESRSLDAARKLGLVLDHELTDERFYYVMRFVPGESLSLLTQRLHAESGPDGLDDQHLRLALGHVAELLGTLDTYHRGGLWHKDVKPDNIIVDRERAHLVDFGLVTPLRSAMTLTTHGTEYFRDPEMVRMALKGVKVHEVDGARFDLYAAGAVLYSVIENNFPAHGGLSQITRRCPDALRWIVRRSMTDYDKRYPSAAAFLADLRVVLDAADPFAVKPVALPSVAGGALPQEPPADEFDLAAVRARTAAGHASAPDSGSGSAAAAAPGAARVRSRPRLRVTDWWKGRYEVLDIEEVKVNVPSGSKSWKLGPVEIVLGAVQAGRNSGRRAGDSGKSRPRDGTRDPDAPRRPASEQLASARARAHEMRQRARARRRTPAPSSSPTGGRFGLAIALLAAAGVVGGITVHRLSKNARISTSLPTQHTQTVTPNTPDPALPPAPPPSEAPPLPTPDAPAERAPGIAGAPGTLLPGLAVLGAAGAAQFLVSTSEDRIVLMIPDVGAEALSSADRNLIGMLEGQLAAQGFEVVGSPFARSITHADALTDWLSEVRYLRGVRPLETDTIEDDLGQWLARTPKVGYVLWLERDPAGRIVPHLFYSRHTSTEFITMVQQNMLDGIAKAAVDFAMQHAGQ